MKKFKKASALILSGALIAGTFSAMITANAAKSETIGSGTALASYENDFNADDLSSALGDDFSFGYDNTNYVATGISIIDKTAASDYLSYDNGTIMRQNKSDEADYGNDGCRPYWQQLYMTYKNQTFGDFEFNVKLQTSAQTFNAINFSPYINSPIYNNGFTFAFKNNVSYNMFLGTAEEARTDLRDWRVNEESTAEHYTTPTNRENDTLDIKITFKSGTAAVYIDGEKVLEKSGLPTVGYYVSFALGSKSYWGSTVIDDFSIKEIENQATSERSETRGSYFNGFGSKTLAAALGDDFYLRYDNENWASAQASTELSVSDAVKYIEIKDGSLRRKNIGETGETDIWDGLRPYWQQVYLYYKNQSFENFEFSADMNFSPHTFNEIRFSPSTDGTIYSSGFTFAVKNDGGNYRMILGDGIEISENLKYENGNNWIISESVAQYVYSAAGNAKINVKIKFDNGKAAVYLDGSETPVLERDGLPCIEYYPSIALGAATGWGDTLIDNLSVAEYDNIVSTEADATGSKLVLRSVRDVKEVGFKATSADGEIKVSTDYVSANARGKLPFKVAQDGVYYADIDLDGDVGATDISSLKITLLSGGDNTAADINGDTLINILDLIKLKKLLTGTDTVEPTTGRYTYYFNTPDGAETVTPYYILNDGTEILGEAVVIG